jgi:hypothetical protein
MHAMPPRRAALTAVLGVLLVALLIVIAFLIGRGSQGAGTPTSAATAVTQATQSAQAPTSTAAAPTATPTAVSATATPAPAPTGQTIQSFVVPQTVKCDAANQTTPSVHLTWTTVDTTGVSISIDGPGKFADYPASGSADVPFACSVAQHTYLLTTHGTGTPATRTVVVKRTN